MDAVPDLNHHLRPLFIGAVRHGDLHPLTLNLPGVDRRGGVIGLCRHLQETLFKFHALKSVKYKRQNGEGHRHSRNGDQDSFLQL